jgi:hypothetical protein
MVMQESSFINLFEAATKSVAKNNLPIKTKANLFYQQ